MLGRWLSALAVLVASSWLCACRSDVPDAADASPDPSAALPPDVDAVLAARCRKCHSDPPINFAPFPLVTWQNTQVAAPGHRAAPVYEIMEMRLHDATFPMPPPGNPITDADRSVLDAWIAQGAPAKR